MRAARLARRLAVEVVVVVTRRGGTAVRGRHGAGGRGERRLETLIGARALRNRNLQRLVHVVRLLHRFVGRG